MRQVVFLIQTADRKGLLAEISSFFYNSGFNILQCRQFSDIRAGRYFMRIALELNAEITRRELEEAFAKFAGKLELEYSVHHLEAKQNVALMVSKASHCLYDLLMHADEGDLVCNIPLIISNHPDLEYVADRFNVPYFCCPMEKGKKAEQEAKVLDLLRSHRIDLVVMARYMQILSDDFIARYPQRIINIHHAFLPAFQGGNPYERAWERGVKMIGATAHYATADLDEGPIIEQDVERISHMDMPEDLKQIGKDIERRVLTRAVRAHLEHRVIVSGRRTIVFS
ncbi:formyltetrahydrofolate deformylase [uncultured Victivallis sp.]|uniref:formyltetrahydrofolate deformylase n=1 Tax=uncultured Victivallis sp. TaxID=354118 RepID=UPI0025D139D2|nr:formyltetrahydrofolate deformylase [uncultured Victivallis sp.]